MIDTIKDKYGYSVVKVKHIITGEEGYRIDDGPYPLFVAKKRSFDDYMNEKAQNDCFNMCEVFTTKKGNQYIYWRDEEIGADYITKVNKTR